MPRGCAVKQTLAVIRYDRVFAPKHFVSSYHTLLEEPEPGDAVWHYYLGQQDLAKLDQVQDYWGRNSIIRYE